MISLLFTETQCRARASRVGCTSTFLTIGQPACQPEIKSEIEIGKLEFIVLRLRGEVKIMSETLNN